MPVLTEPSPRQLEDAIARRLAGAEVAEAVGIHPAAEELEGMLSLSDQIAALEHGAPAAGARSRVRDAFVQGGLAAALMLALFAGSSLALAAQLAEPDSSLYPLKLDSERLLVAANRSAVAKAGVRLELANQRYRDSEAMAARGKGALAVQSMRAYYDQLRLAGAELAGAPHDRSWKVARDQFTGAESKPIDGIITQLQNTRQTAALAGIKALADQFAKDRKAIDAKLKPGAAAPVGPQPQPLPSGAQTQP